MRNRRSIFEGVIPGRGRDSSSAVAKDSWVGWFLFVSVSAGLCIALLRPRSSSEQYHQHNNGAVHTHGSRGEVVLLEVRCAGAGYLHDVDGEPRCTADDTVPTHARAWERRIVDAGWFTLVSAATQRALRLDTQTGHIACIAEYEDAAVQWRFEHLPAGETHDRGLGNRAGRGMRVQVADIEARRSVLIAKPSYYESSVFRPKPLSREAYDASVDAQKKRDTIITNEDQAARTELRRLFGGSSKGHLRSSRERMIISMALYGALPKYNEGAIRNAELVDAYFPGWQLRVYADGDTVPTETLDELRRLGAEVKVIHPGAHSTLATGAIAGMFWRFLVADDADVDRFIVRDSDSRLNPRDAFAVAEWVESGVSTHTIRDHPNHARPLNGGMWGATRDSQIHGQMRHLASRFDNHESYGADLDFLQLEVFPLVEDDLLAHDSYSCDSYDNSRSFPTKRPSNFQHVGQVFDEHDRPRMDDVESYMRGLRVPFNCRRQEDWIYG